MLLGGPLLIVGHTAAMLQTNWNRGRVVGRWPIAGFPERIRVHGRVFRRINWIWPDSTGVVVQYREESDRQARLLVLNSGEISLDDPDDQTTEQRDPAAPVRAAHDDDADEPAPARSLANLALGAVGLLLGIGLVSAILGTRR